MFLAALFWLGLVVLPRLCPQTVHGLAVVHEAYMWGTELRSAAVGVRLQKWLVLARLLQAL